MDTRKSDQTYQKERCTIDDVAIDNDEDSPGYGKPEIILFYISSKGGVETVGKYKTQF